ncbi:MAG: hypothetical protein LW823_01925 [Rickettsiales bacterium]|jgi:isocitrate/isopropylmalate dehydrogenase|nr:hypothetical protein [Rickettsiales bacterium]
MSIPVTIAYGDNESPAFIDSALFILREAGAQLTLETIEIGSRIYGMNYNKGILPSSFDSLKRTKCLLIGGAHMPQKEGFEHVCHVIRQHFGLSDEHRDEEGLNVDEGTMIRAISYINDDFAMFEAADETSSSTLLAAIMLLEHCRQSEVAADVKNALQQTLKTGINKPSLLSRLLGQSPPDAMLFAETVCGHLGKKPSEKSASSV